MIIKNDIAKGYNRMYKRKVKINPFECEKCGFTGRLVTGFPRNCIQKYEFVCPKCNTSYRF